MRAVFNTEQAKACHTSQDFDTWIKQSPEKDFLIGKVYAKTAATLTAIKAAAKSLHVNLPAQAGEGGKHKAYIKKIISRMRDAVKGSEDAMYANACLNRADPAGECEDLVAWCASLLVCHRQGTQAGELSERYGWVYMPKKDTKDSSRKDSRVPEAEAESA